MHNIKFRAWNNISKKMWDWESIVLDSVILASVMRDEFFATYPPKYFWIVQQYTEIRDENDNEIYDGDLLIRFKRNAPGSTVYLVDFNNENHGGVLGWNLLEYGVIDNNGTVCEYDKVAWEKSDVVYYPPYEFYYGESPSDQYTIVGNIIEGIDEQLLSN